MLSALLGIGALCMVVERWRPGWILPRVPTWPLRVIAVNLVQVGVVLLAGVSWDRWLSRWSLFHLGAAVHWSLGGLIAYLISTFIFYWWHRWRHEVGLLWRGFHQIHHSPQRIELITSFYKHPLEMMVNSIIGSALTYCVLGLGLEGAACYTACCALGEFFYHTSVRTPRWIGYIFQRPEMHRVHHQHGRHRNNYGDLACWDMLFGTYENPAAFTATCGFDADQEERLGAMLLFRDVHRTPALPAARFAPSVSGRLAGLLLLGAAMILCSCTRTVTEQDLFQPRRVVLAEAPEHAHAMRVQREPGVTISGWVLTCGEHAPTLVYFCGNAETVADAWPRIAWLSRTLAVNVAAFDYRGYGASSGEPGLKTCGEDAAAIVQALRAQPDLGSAPLIVYGRSLGGGMSVYAATHGPVDALVLEAPPASCPEVVAGWNANLPWYARWCVTLRPSPALSAPELQPLVLIAALRCPLLVMHGDLDTVIPQAQGRALYERAGSADKRFLPVPASGHNDLRIDLEPARGALLAFVSALARPGG